jgi:hypothetical protein
VKPIGGYWYFQINWWHLSICRLHLLLRQCLVLMGLQGKAVYPLLNLFDAAGWSEWSLINISLKITIALVGLNKYNLWHHVWQGHFWL